MNTHISIEYRQVVHCTSKVEAEKVLEAIKRRLAEVKLQIKEEKTRIA